MQPQPNKRKILHLLLVSTIILLTLSAIVMVTQYVTGNSDAQGIIQDYGYFSIVILSFIAGLNIIVPVPAASFVPIFVAGGISLITIISLLVLGTMIADLVAYAIGRISKTFTATHYPALQTKITHLYTDRKHLLPYFVFGFSAFIPIPNDVYLIPLGIMGVPLRSIIFPLIAGTMIYQTLATLGIYNVFLLLV